MSAFKEQQWWYALPRFPLPPRFLAISFKSVPYEESAVTGESSWKWNVCLKPPYPWGFTVLWDAICGLWPLTKERSFEISSAQELVSMGSSLPVNIFYSLITSFLQKKLWGPVRVSPSQRDAERMLALFALWEMQLVRSVTSPEQVDLSWSAAICYTCVFQKALINSRSESVKAPHKLIVRS